MGGLSPVVEAFLRGQQGQTDILQAANDIANRKKALELEEQRRADAVAQFEKNFKLQTDRQALEQQIYDLNKKKAEWDIKQAIGEGLRSGSIPQPTHEEVDPSSFIGNGIPSYKDVPDSTYTMDTPFGAITVPVPLTKDQSALEQAKALMPLEVERTKLVKGIEHEYDVDLQDRAAKNQLTRDEAQRAFDKWQTQYKGNIDLQIAGMNAARMREMMYFQMGLTGAAATDNDILMTHALRRATGQEDPSDLKGMPLNNTVQRIMGQLGWGDLPGGEKSRNTIKAIGVDGAGLLNMFDDINKTFPPATNFVGQMGQRAKSVDYPIIGPISDQGKKFAQFNSNLIKYAQLMSNLTSSRVMDSNKEQNRFMAAMPSANDTPWVRSDKRLDLMDKVFTKIQDNISGLSTDVRKYFWKEIITGTPTFTNMLNDNGIRTNVFNKIMDSGSYDPSYFNELRTQLRAKYGKSE